MQTLPEIQRIVLPYIVVETYFYVRRIKKLFFCEVEILLDQFTPIFIDLWYDVQCYVVIVILVDLDGLY